MAYLYRSSAFLLLFLFWLGFLASCGRPQARRSDREHTNELINSSSPYLLQHAHNPVNWYPYGEKALGKAKKENKLMIVSVGYAACHWCHVMEEETFEDTVAANTMNKYYVSVKVDREERPDVDDVYMSACQLVSQEPCGWPLNVFCLPDGRPFFAVTYAPREEWIGAIEHFAKMYEDEPETLEEYAQRLTEGVVQSSLLPAIDSVRQVFPSEGVDTVARRFLRTVDFERGGHLGSPKFPLPSHFAFLLEYHHYSGDPQALQAVESTLLGMARGGIYDQLGGGFARYSTDDRWHIPHFEKMLYDNAQLVSLYARAWRVDPNPIYRKVVEETLDFVERELMHPEQGFYSSLDADSEGEEGTYYVWTADDLRAAVPSKELRGIVEKAYDFSPIGNWEGYKNVLHFVQTEAALASEMGLSEEALGDSLDRARALMLEYRSQRERPGLDDKILTAWNSLMVEAYLEAHYAFGSPEYLETALKNGRFLRDRMMDEEGRLWRIYKDEKRSINGFLDDYALTIQAFIELYEATFDESWLEAAHKLADYAHTHFFDERSGLYYFTSDLDPPLVTRKMEIMDDVIPASNSVMAHNLFKLGHFFYEEAYLQRARHMMTGIYETLQEVEQPHYYANWSRLYLRYLQPAWEVAIVGSRAEALRQEMHRHFIPNALLLGGEEEGSLELLQGKLQEGETYIYVCQNKVCRLPVQQVEEALAQMR